MNKEIKKYTEMFHYTYEMLALNFGYETRKDTKKFDFDTPNGKLMYATVEKIISPILEENQQLKEQLETSEKARKEAIDYIKELYDNTDDTTCYDIDKDEKERLLQILDIDKGE